MLAALGVLTALIERGISGKGQIVETAMVRLFLTRTPHSLMRLSPQVTGTRYAASFPLLMSRPSLGLSAWDRPRGENRLDGGAPWYNVYETSDGGYMSIGAVESHFYTMFLCVFPLLKFLASSSC